MDIETHTQGKGHVKLKAEIRGGMLPEAKVTKIASNPQKLKRGLDQTRLHGLRRNRPHPHPDRALPASRAVRESSFLLFKPLGLRSFVKAH